jgi:hypothetical protein
VRFSHQMTYDADPDAVHRMLVDPAFREKVCTAMHASRREVSVDRAGAGMTVVVDQTQPARGIPSFATRFVGEEIRIVQRETWRDSSGGSLEIAIPGKPGTFAGTLELAADGAGTVESVTGEVKVKVPMLGGRLEALVGDLLRTAFRTEEHVGRAWLAGDR